MNPPNQDTRMGVEHLFSYSILKFLRQNRSQSSEFKTEARLFFNVVSLAIKYFYSEDAFKDLLSRITDLLDGHVNRVKPALTFFA